MRVWVLPRSAETRTFLSGSSSSLELKWADRAVHSFGQTLVNADEHYRAVLNSTGISGPGPRSIGTHLKALRFLDAC